MAFIDSLRQHVRIDATDAQMRYADVLEWGARLSLVVITIGFVFYVVGWPAPLVPMDRLPEVWGLPVAEYLRATGVPTGWAWLADLGHGDVVGELGVAMLALCSIPAVLALVPLYRARGDKVFVALCVAQAAVIASSASGLFSLGH